MDLLHKFDHVKDEPSSQDMTCVWFDMAHGTKSDNMTHGPIRAHLAHGPMRAHMGPCGPRAQSIHMVAAVCACIRIYVYIYTYITAGSN
jgi:hypothetical protein